MDRKTIFSILLAIAAVIGVGSGYCFDNGKNTVLLVLILIGLVVLSIAYHTFEKLQDEKYGNKVGKF